MPNTSRPLIVVFDGQCLFCNAWVRFLLRHDRRGVFCFAAIQGRYAFADNWHTLAEYRWLGVKDGHHTLSHEPDDNKDAVENLIKINEWFAGELAYLTKKLAETPEPGGDGTMLDNTLIVWLNELGKGNSHTLDDIPFVLLGGGLDDLQLGYDGFAHALDALDEVIPVLEVALLALQDDFFRYGRANTLDAV